MSDNMTETNELATENAEDSIADIATDAVQTVDSDVLTAAMDEFMLARYGVEPLADDAGDVSVLASAIEPVASAPMMASALSASATGITKPTYTPHEWVNGADGGTLPLNAANLNEIEAGISGNCEAIGNIIDDVNGLRDSQSRISCIGQTEARFNTEEDTAYLEMMGTDAQGGQLLLTTNENGLMLRRRQAGGEWTVVWNLRK